jgi:hypothetical protein
MDIEEMPGINLVNVKVIYIFQKVYFALVPEGASLIFTLHILLCKYLSYNTPMYL